MNIAVIGLWHLGCVTAACLANKGFHVIGYDPDAATVAALASGKTPIFEPDLDDLLAEAQHKNTLQYSANPSDLQAADIAWITFDTPVDENDHADTAFVIQQIQAVLPFLQKNTCVLISSQLPIGTSQQLQQYCAQHFSEKNITFAYSPENLRLGKAIQVFSQPERVVIGLAQENDKSRLQQLFNPFTQHIIWMSIASAEMTKHALNAFLATSVVFINEISMLCEQVGADAREVEHGLKSEARIGPKAYLRPGGPIAGGTLMRDVNYLIQAGDQHHLPTPLFSALLASNESHKQWYCRRVLAVLKNLKDKKIAALGLTYKAGTDTLRRSTAVETCQWFKSQGAQVVAFDPAISQLPQELQQDIQLSHSLQEALAEANAIIISTECPEFTLLNPELLLAHSHEPYVFDASGYLAQNLGQDARIKYFSVGRSQ